MRCFLEDFTFDIEFTRNFKKLLSVPLSHTMKVDYMGHSETHNLNLSFFQCIKSQLFLSRHQT